MATIGYTPANIDIQLIIEDDNILPVVIADGPEDQEVGIDLTNITIEGQARLDAYSNTGFSLNITKANQTTNPGMFFINFTRADTANLRALSKAKTYRYDIQMTDALDVRRTVITGTIILNVDITTTSIPLNLP